MREDGLQARIKRRFKCTTDSAHSHGVAHNHLDRAFSPAKPNMAWAVDMTYIWTKEGWLYLAIVMDLYSRRIIGWSAGPRMKTALPLEALNRAIALRGPLPGLMHHSDRGSQYCAYEYRNRLAQIGAVPSMSGKGNCYDNAVVETFFKTLKSELVWRMTFHSRAQALSEIGQYIDGFYNPVRWHSACAYTSPIKYEMIKNQTQILSTLVKQVHSGGELCQSFCRCGVDLGQLPQRDSALSLHARLALSGLYVTITGGRHSLRARRRAYICFSRRYGTLDDWRYGVWFWSK